MLVYYPGASFLLASPLTKDRKQYVMQALIQTLHCTEIQEWGLTGKHIGMIERSYLCIAIGYVCVICIVIIYLFVETAYSRPDYYMRTPFVMGLFILPSCIILWDIPMIFNRCTCIAGDASTQSRTS